MLPPRKKIGKVGSRFLVIAAVIFAAILGINFYIILSSKHRIFSRITDLPHREFALVLGTEPLRPDGTTNLHFIKRTDLAAKVYLGGTVRHLLISGNENNRGFNEVLEMKKRILGENVPESALELDFGGRRTFESIRRARDIYHLRKIIIVTDSFHAPRVIFLCQHFGIDAVAICPEQDPFSLWYFRYHLKEYFARVVAVMDILTLKNHEPNQ